MANQNYSIRFQALDGFSRTMERFSRRMDTANRKVKQTEKGWKTAGKSMMATGAGLSKFVTTPLVGVAAAAVKTGSDFEKSMSKVEAISGATGDQMSEMTDVARELGSTTPRSATEAAEGMKFLGQAGFDAKETMAAIPPVLDLSIAGNLELADAADIASNVMEGFGMEANEAGKMADVLAESATSANTNVNEMGTAMSYVAPVANSAGISLEETSAAIGHLSDAGRNAA